MSTDNTHFDPPQPASSAGTSSLPQAPAKMTAVTTHPSAPQPAAQAAPPATPATLSYAKAARPIPRLTRFLLILAGIQWLLCAVAGLVAIFTLLWLTNSTPPILVAQPEIIRAILIHLFVGTLFLSWTSYLCLRGSRWALLIAAAFALHLLMLMLSLAPMVIVTGLRMCQDAHIGLLLASAIFAIYFVPLLFIGILCLLHIFPLSLRKLRPEDPALATGRVSLLNGFLVFSAMHAGLFFCQCYAYPSSPGTGLTHLPTLALVGMLLGGLTTAFLRRRPKLSILPALGLYGLATWLIATTIMDHRFFLEPNNLLGIGLILHIAILCIGHLWYGFKSSGKPTPSRLA